MRIAKRKQNLFLVVVAGVLLTLGLPAAAFAAPQGYGYDHGFNKGQRKCEKFVNCHDARDGRWDGRGRRADRRWNYVRRDRVYYNGVNRNYLDQWRLARREDNTRDLRIDGCVSVISIGPTMSDGEIVSPHSAEKKRLS